jgi:hypothetical protein
MENNNQTPVEFAVEKLEKFIPSGNQLIINIILEQAKEMESQKDAKYNEMVEMLKEILDSVDWSDNVWVNSQGRYIENKIEKLIKEATQI